MARQETIRLYRSDVAAATPSLTAGEIAVNLQDGKLFIGGTNGAATDLLFLDQSQQMTVKGLAGTIQFANTAIDDLQADNGLKFNFTTDSALEIPASLRIGQTVANSLIEFGDGSTQGTAYTGSINGGTF